MIGELAASRIVAEANTQEIRKLTDQLAKQPQSVGNISPSPSSQCEQSPTRRRACHVPIVEVITSLVDNFVVLTMFSGIIVINLDISHVVVEV